MNNRITFGPRPASLPAPGAAPSLGSAPAAGFDQALARAMGSVKLSAHATQRLQASRRTLTPAELAAIGAAMEKAAAKGARESLLLLPDVALVVSVPNRTVITAVEGSRMRENLFTNIDSAVIL